MVMELSKIAEHVEALAEKESVTGLAKRLGVSRQTIYNVMAGNWPNRDLMNALEIKLFWKKGTK
jgi:predicted transcriptional regulator